MIKQFISTLALTMGVSAFAHAIPVTINMTADNKIVGGGLCATSACTGGTMWSALGTNTANFSNWQRSSSVTVDLGAGTHYFTWQILNSGAPAAGNPAGLLAEILWDNGANYSSSAWEVYNFRTGSTIENATEYGANGGSNIWGNVNGGAVAGISTNANWIYTRNNFQNAPVSAWIRTSITIAEVPEPATMAMMGMGLALLGFVRRKQSQKDA